MYPHYGSDALAEVHNHDNMNNNVVNQAVQVMPSSQQSNVVNHSETKITSDSNIIPYSQYVIESQQATINLENKSVNDTLTAELERYKEQVKVLKEGQNVDSKSQNNVSDTCAQSKEASRNIDREIALEKHIKHLDNIVFKRDQSAQTVHMLTKPQFFYDNTTKQALEPTLSITPTNVEVPKELPKVSMVNTSLKKLKHHLANFDVLAIVLQKDKQIQDFGPTSGIRASFDLDLFKLAIVLQKDKQIQDFGPTSGIRASRGTLMMMKHHTMKMHQTMEGGVRYDGLKMEHYLEYINNDVWKTDNLKGVPHPLTGDYTPKPQQEIDESLYVYGKKGPQKHETSISDDKFNEYSTCQSNDNAGSFGNPSEHSFEFESEIISVPKKVSESKSVTTNEKVVSEPKPKEVEPSCVTHVKTLRKDNGKRVLSLKKQRVFNTVMGWQNPVRNNANRDNHLITPGPRPVKTQCCKPNSNSVSLMVNTGRANDHPLKNIEDRGIFDSGCLGNMTGNKDHLDDFEECKRGSVTFGGRKGYITGKGRIRVDASGISMSANNEIFEGMGNMGYPSDESKHPYLAIVLTKKIFGNMKRGFRGVPRPLLPAMLPVVAVDQSAGQADQAVTQPSPSEPLPSSSPPPVISATTESEPTPVAESTSHPTSPSPEHANEPTEHTFEQPSPEHQHILPNMKTEIPQSQDLTHPHVAEKRTMTVDDLLHLVPKLITKVDSLEKELQQTKLTMGKAIVKLVKKMEDVLKRRHVVLTDSEDEDAKNSSKQGRNLQEEGLDEMVRSIMKDKSKDFETPTQGKTSGEADISPEGLEAAETLAKVLTQRTKTYTRKVKTGLRRKLDADEVNTGEGINTGFTDVNTAFEEIKSRDDEVNSGDESIIPSSKKGPREGKAVLEEKSQSKRTMKLDQESKLVGKKYKLQAQEEAENARKA
ncbi:hypothetical protein Tco_0528281 [Tanacetum coccineum]